LNYIKGREDPVALKDDEYPEWLWSCLNVKKKVGLDEGVGGDEFCELFIHVFRYTTSRVSRMTANVSVQRNLRSFDVQRQNDNGSWKLSYWLRATRLRCNPRSR
jgi:hypothetical protein